MKDDKLNVVGAWFKKAENDLINAENTIKMGFPPTDTICFHAQQCAEKYLDFSLVYSSHNGFRIKSEIKLSEYNCNQDLVSSKTENQIGFSISRLSFSRF